MNKLNKKAIIYCYVSSTKEQDVADRDLQTQEQKCRLYAEEQGYSVCKVIHDVVWAGTALMNRPAVIALLRFLKFSREEYIVIFDDWKRFGRDMMSLSLLRRRLAAYGTNSECISFRDEKWAEGKFVEAMLAAQEELERDFEYRNTSQKRGVGECGCLRNVQSVSLLEALQGKLRNLLTKLLLQTKSVPTNKNHLANLWSKR